MNESEQSAAMPAHTEDMGERFAGLWRRHRERLSLIERAVAQARDDERRVLGNDRFAHTFPLHLEVNQSAKTRVAVRECMVDEAEERFSKATGVPFTVDWARMEREMGAAAGFESKPQGGRAKAKRGTAAQRRAALDEAFDPRALWRWLETTYGDDAARERGWQQAAAVLAERLPTLGPALVAGDGRLVLRIPAVMEEELWSRMGWAESTPGWPAHSYDQAARFRVQDACHALATALAWMGRDDDARALRARHDDLQLWLLMPEVGQTVEVGSIAFEAGGQEIMVRVPAELVAGVNDFVVRFHDRAHRHAATMTADTAQHEA